MVNRREKWQRKRFHYSYIFIAAIYPLAIFVWIFKRKSDDTLSDVTARLFNSHTCLYESRVHFHKYGYSQPLRKCLNEHCSVWGYDKKESGKHYDENGNETDKHWRDL